jgi:predicted dehydrogenase
MRPDRAGFGGPAVRVRLGLVGCGRLAEVGYVPAFRLARGVRLAAVADLDLSRCRGIAPGVPAYATVQGLVESGNVDGLIVSTPSSSHLTVATCAAQSKIPVLVEKPPGVDLKTAEALLNLTPPPWIGFNRRFAPDIAALKSAATGKAMSMRLELHYRRTTWRPFEMRDDALLDLGPHLIDLARWLTEAEIRSVRARVLKPHCAECELDLERGHAVISCSTNRPYMELVQIHDDQGRRLGMSVQGGVIAGLLARIVRPRENPLVSSLVRELEAFGAAVAGDGSGCLATAWDGAVVMSVMDAVRQSAANGGIAWPVPRVDRGTGACA